MSARLQRAAAEEARAPETPPAPLPVVDGLELPDELRRLLRPGEPVADAAGRRWRLPRWFYEIESWQVAKETQLAPYFMLHELIAVDVREPAPLRAFPRYVPLAITHLAAHLSALRQHLGTYVHVAANGGYRSPAHPAGEAASVHRWGTAANLYRVGDDCLDSEATVGRYAEIVRRVLPAAWCRPWGRRPGETIDHLHLDLGRVRVAPRDVAEESDDGEGVPGEADDG
ncbi:MAG TPA: hypothetical protein VHM02_00170 [Thermoanaerobaculia bacterium]|nr:hypothetical protein [Thermoanaerobaculia bacterium]